MVRRSRGTASVFEASGWRIPYSICLRGTGSLYPAQHLSSRTGLTAICGIRTGLPRGPCCLRASPDSSGCQRSRYGCNTGTPQQLSAGLPQTRMEFWHPTTGRVQGIDSRRIAGVSCARRIGGGKRFPPAASLNARQTKPAPLSNQARANTRMRPTTTSAGGNKHRFGGAGNLRPGSNNARHYRQERRG